MPVTDDIDGRLAAAIEAVQERDSLIRELQPMRKRETRADRELARLLQRCDQEQAKVERLENLTSSRVLATLRGDLKVQLERERAAVAAVQAEAQDARARLDALRQKIAAGEARLSDLADAHDDYQAALAAKVERADADTSHAARLLALAEERSQLLGELREVRETAEVVDEAFAALERAKEKVGSASKWSTYDTFFGGGMVESAIKHHRLDDAVTAVHDADSALDAVRAQLTDIDVKAGWLEVTKRTRTIDIWFDNIFTSLKVRGKIKDMATAVADSHSAVRQVKDDLADRQRQAEARLGEVEDESRQVLSDSRYG